MRTSTKTYYPDGGAMRVNTNLYYVLKDHTSTRLSTSLGSASVVTNSDRLRRYGTPPPNLVGRVEMNKEEIDCGFGGGWVGAGETRFATGTMYTDKLFTGQREMRRPERSECSSSVVEGTGLGIYHYGTRYREAERGSAGILDASYFCLRRFESPVAL